MQQLSMTELKYIVARVVALNDYGGADPLVIFAKNNNIEDDVFFTRTPGATKEECKINKRVLEIALQI